MNKYRQRFLPLEYRFWWKAAMVGAGEDDCWEWRACIQRNGYGRFDSRGAHRVAYELAVGPIPDGLELDHLCRNRSCVNPRHLEPVTSLENRRRSLVTIASVNAAKTHCRNGHPFDDENTYTHRGERTCRSCARAATQAWRERSREMGL